MDNEKQIKNNELEKSKSQFLPSVFEDPEGAVDVYSLDDEYAKTKNNGSYFLKLFVGAFLIAVICAAIIITVFEQRNQKRSAINIDDFGDIKVQEMLSQNKKYQSEIKSLKSEIDDLRSGKNGKLSQIRRNYDRMRDTIKTKPLTEEERNRELILLNRQMNREINVEKNKYDSMINSKNNKISVLNQKVEDNNKKIGSNSDKEAILTSSDMLQSIEINNIKEEYEKKIDEINENHRQEIQALEDKYNPVFRQSYLTSIINKRAKRIAMPGEFLSGVTKDLERQKISTSEDVNKMRKNIEMQIALLERMQKIPYRNSVPKSLIHTESISKEIYTDYDKMVTQLVRVLRRQILMLNNFDKAFSYSLQNEKENGYILDASNSTRVGVYLSRIYDIRTGDLALVFRQDDEYIGTIRFKYISGILFAETVETVSGKKIQPFDKILLKMVKAE